LLPNSRTGLVPAEGWKVETLTVDRCKGSLRRRRSASTT
jgi:hypothetical protein